MVKKFLPAGKPFTCNCGAVLYKSSVDFYENTAISADRMIPVDGQHEAINDKPITCYNCGTTKTGCIRRFIEQFQNLYSHKDAFRIECSNCGNIQSINHLGDYGYNNNINILISPIGDEGALIKCSKCQKEITINNYVD